MDNFSPVLRIIEKFFPDLEPNALLYCSTLHHNLFITLLWGPSQFPWLLSKPCYIESKMYSYMGKSVIMDHSRVQYRSM